MYIICIIIFSSINLIVLLTTVGVRVIKLENILVSTFLMCFRFFWLCGSTVNAQGVVGSGGRRMAERDFTGGTRIPEVEVTSTLAEPQDIQIQWL